MDEYLVWSNEHMAWWNPNHSGYTSSTAAAGRYSRDEALRICRGRDGWKASGVSPEIPVLASDVGEIERMKFEPEAG